MVMMTYAEGRALAASVAALEQIVRAMRAGPLVCCAACLDHRCDECYCYTYFEDDNGRRWQLLCGCRH